MDICMVRQPKANLVSPWCLFVCAVGAWGASPHVWQLHAFDKRFWYQRGSPHVDRASGRDNPSMFDGAPLVSMKLQVWAHGPNPKTGCQPQSKKRVFLNTCPLHIPRFCEVTFKMCCGHNLRYVDPFAFSKAAFCVFLFCAQL